MIYLDNNATTRVDPAVLEAMLPWFSERWGNASAAYGLGHQSEGAIAHARDQVAALLGCEAAELVFNGGGTEGLNHAFRGVFEAFPQKRHFITTAVEHSAVLAICDWLEKQDAEVTRLGVDGEGRLDLAALEAALRPDTAMVSAMAANNETGVLFPLEEIGSLAKARGALFHVDATQAIGKVEVDAKAWGADLLNLSAHKLHGPKGVGALYIRRGLRLKPFMLGGHQERSRRGGTENVPGIVGLGKAAELAKTQLPGMDRVRTLRDGLEAAILSIPDTHIHGAGSPRLPNTCFAGFAGVEGEALLLKLAERGVCVSTGSACTTGQKEPSHVLRAMHAADAYTKGTVRLTLSRETTAGEIDIVKAMLPELVKELRALSPFGR